MATRVEQTVQQTSLHSHVLIDDFAHSTSAKTAPLFSAVLDEPFVQPNTLGLALTSARARSLQRCVDLALATICLMILWPIMVTVGILVLVTSPGPVFYGQPRVGCDRKIFRCLKFRTMQIDAETRLNDILESSPALREVWSRDRKLRDDPRITPIGRILRRYSIDELPQLFNVMRGEMSIVGPRPIATDEASLYGELSTYCSLKPGLTGPWQVGGRNQTSFRARAQLDWEYARTKSYSQDFRLILRTIPVVLRGTGL
jgi:exopolysaccharide production protein ExoY